MIISEVKLEGFRNFKNATINLAEKSLVIGSNEIGKSNLLYALRILLDRTLSPADLEPDDSDFYVYEETNDIKIQLKFERVVEDCLISKFREYVSEDAELYLAYHASRDAESKKKTFYFMAGRSPETLTNIETNRFYLRVLSLKFIGSKRDLFSFIRSERKNLIQDAKSERSDNEITDDNKLIGDIETGLNSVHGNVSSLSYVSKATQSINSELDSLSIRNVGQNIIFDTGASDPSQYVDNLRLATQIGDKTLAIGGDGRNSQIHLALWAARNRPIFESEDEPLEVNIFCIEEPESHLHPHQQRKLSQYLSDTLQSQVIITTHSPQIATGFPPASIIRLYNNGPDTLAAGSGSSPFIEAAFIEFGFRLNIIPAEAFFASLVLLVEGTSEELFYKALAKTIDIDLDRLNISVLTVEGIGYKPYISLFHSLNIKFVVRTDNDIFKIPNKKEYRCAGVERGINIYRNYFEEDEKLEKILTKDEPNLKGFSSRKLPQESLDSAQRIIAKLEEYNIFLAEVDLEHDMRASKLSDALIKYFKDIDEDEIITKMKNRKATTMFDFLRSHSESLADLKTDNLAKLLLRCEHIALSSYDTSSE